MQTNPGYLPLVSIVIPVYNGAKYMREAIDSALAQTYQNIEVLVINDGSKDDGKSEKIAKFYGERIRYFSKENGGVASAVNRGIREMKGEYFAWLSHDDIFMAEKIALQIEFLKQNPSFAACYTDYMQIDAQGNKLRQITTPWLPREKALKILFGQQYINGSTMVVRRNCFDQVGIFNEHLRYTQDTEMWFRLLQRYKVGQVAKPLVKQRLHNEQSSCQKQSHQKEARELLEHLFNDLGTKGLLDDKKKTSGDSEKLARRHIWFERSVGHRQGWYDLGNAHLKQALNLWPSLRNPARMYMLFNHMLPALHAWQRLRVYIVHWTMKRIRNLTKKT